MEHLSDDIIDQITYHFNDFIETTNLDDLLTIYIQLRQAYYNDMSYIDDDLYTKLEDIVKEKRPDDPIFNQVGALPKGERYKLPYMMGSLDKIKPGTNDLSNYIKKFQGP